MTALVQVEPFVHLVDLGPDRALIGWGAFWFCRDDPADRWQLVGDAELAQLVPGRTSSIGAGSEPYGHAVLEVLDGAGASVAQAHTADANHVWVHGLAPCQGTSGWADRPPHPYSAWASRRR